MYKRQPQPNAAVLPAAGLIHPEEGLKDALLVFLRVEESSKKGTTIAVELPVQG